jgi:hypothetical protein
MSIKVKIPIKTVSEANKNEHWAKSYKRRQGQKKMVKFALAPKLDALSDSESVIITLTRIAPRFLDRWENLPMAFKYVLDSICELLIPGKAIGQADSDKRIEVKYEQMKGMPKEYAIQVEIIKDKNE